MDLRTLDKTRLKSIALEKGLPWKFNGRNVSKMRKQDFIDFIEMHDHESDWEEDTVEFFGEILSNNSFQPIVQILGWSGIPGDWQQVRISERASESEKLPPKEEREPKEEDDYVPDLILKEVCECARSTSNIAENLKIKTNIKDIETKITCVICRSNMRNTLFSPCNHLATCIACSKNPLLEKCPMCRAQFEQTRRVFY